MTKNIIFELGGVILNIDYEQVVIEFKKLGIQDFNQLFSRAVQKDLFADFETGKITADSFRNELRKLSKLPLSDKDIDCAWNAILLNLPKKRLELLQKINQNHRCFLLSNTNKIHYDQFQINLMNEHNISGYENLFEKAYFSHQLGLRKPGAAIFEFVISQHQLKAEETLFVDDSIQNIIAAKQLGLQTLFIDTEKNQEIENYFSLDEQE